MRACNRAMSLSRSVAFLVKVKSSGDSVSARCDILMSHCMKKPRRVSFNSGAASEKACIASNGRPIILAASFNCCFNFETERILPKALIRNRMPDVDSIQRINSGTSCGSFMISSLQWPKISTAKSPFCRASNRLANSSTFSPRMPVAPWSVPSAGSEGSDGTAPSSLRLRFSAGSSSSRCWASGSIRGGEAAPSSRPNLAMMSRRRPTPPSCLTKRVASSSEKSVMWAAGATALTPAPAFAASAGRPLSLPESAGSASPIGSLSASARSSPSSAPALTPTASKTATASGTLGRTSARLARGSGT
mmetsp:Transcript_120247/g.336670  ORF Transcript_120247/g.336670 Transcript_120247/m.336670 type:complete len:305 (-) Transcript_120247:177-1091(-)